MMYALAIAIVFALYEARRDVVITPVHGWKFWLRRAVIFGVTVLLLSFLVEASLLSMLVGGAAAFAIAHRYTYNRFKGQKWDYISESNDYDWWFIQTFGKWGGKMAYACELFIVMLTL